MKHLVYQMMQNTRPHKLEEKMHKKPLMITILAISFISVILLGWAIFESSNDGVFFTLIAVLYFIFGIANFLFFMTNYREKKGYAAVYFLVAVSFWGLSIFNLSVYVF
ncbi:hypothetical protein [Jeotgalibacillus sp. R-1-5s-1]|uniref:hypothetical protein n=1 Tax=Jeotgalibacillus sp. R-1-5s-1 TaxID=2555897 RepID=UPI00106A77AC|nr:hypothetical protein [Jeotgalibacillus sp. R-1-5s-1]TFD99526.1 hypothetical protein E2491_07375 [Jeotgalibacillus sp. R-1-5s-1]